MPKLRFSLKFLLLGICVCAGLAAWYAVVYQQRQFRAQELAKLVPVNITVDFHGKKVSVPDRAEYLATPFAASGSNWSWLFPGNEALPIQKLVLNPLVPSPWYSKSTRQLLERRFAEANKRFDLRAVPELEELDILQQYNLFQVETAGALSNLKKVRYFANEFLNNPVIPRGDRLLSRFVQALPLMPQLQDFTTDNDWSCIEGNQFAGLLAKAPNLQKLELAVGELGPEDAAAMNRLAELTEVKLCFHEPRAEHYYDFIQAVLQRPKLKTASLINYPVTLRGHPFNPDPPPPNDKVYELIEQDFGQADRTLELRDSPLVTLKMKSAPRFMAERCPALTKVEIDAASAEVTMRDCTTLKEFSCNARIANLENCPQLQQFDDEYTQRMTLRNVPLLKKVSFELLDELIVKEGVTLEEITLKNYIPEDDGKPRRGVLPFLDQTRGILPPIPTLQRLELEYLTPELLESLAAMKALPQFPAVELQLNGLDEIRVQEFLTTLPLRKLRLYINDFLPVLKPEELHGYLSALDGCEGLEELDLYGLTYFFRPHVLDKNGHADESFEAMSSRWTLELPPNLKVLRVSNVVRVFNYGKLEANDPMVWFLKKKYPKVKIEVY